MYISYIQTIFMKPREKIIKYWAERLDWKELVATILGSWIEWTDIFKLSKEVYKTIEKKSWILTLEDLEKIKWIWKVKAIQIVSAFELAKRYLVLDSILIESIPDILAQVKKYRYKKQEYLICITLDWANRLISKEIVTIWLLNQSLVHPREIFAKAIEDRANSIVLIHNHPSWSNFPSKADIKVTERLNDVAKLVWIKLLDHIIITKNNYFSFNEEGMFS